MNVLCKRFPLLVFLLFLSLVSCAQSSGTGSVKQGLEEERDLSCAYFYFLWGTHAEFSNRYEEALDAYEKALVCDPGADYIRKKLPLLLINKGEPGRAIAMLQDSIRENPADTDRRSLLARIYMQQKMEDKAIEQYRAVLSYDPKDTDILLRLGALLSQTDDPEKGRPYLEKRLSLEPDDYFSHLFLARIAEQLDDTEQAIRHFNKALEINWSAELSYEFAEYLLQADRNEEAIEVYQTVLADDETAEQARLGVVQALLAMGREEEAIAELSLTDRFGKTSAQISMVLSKLYLRNGNSDQAIEHLRTILQNGENSEARYLLGITYSNVERYDEALDVLSAIGPEQEDFEDSVFLRTKILHQTDRLPEALEMLESLIKQKESSKPLFFLLAASLYQEREEPERSLAILADGAARYPEDEQILFEYGLQLERTGQLDRAMEIMQQVIELDPDHAEALNFVGYTWADRNVNLSRARDYIVRAMQLKPGNGYIQDSLGWVYYRLGNLDRAVAELQGAVELLPRDPHVHEHLGDVYRDLGRIDAALAAYEQALEYQDDEKKRQALQEKIEQLRHR